MFINDDAQNNIQPQRIYNSHYCNGVPAMFTSQYYLKLRGKHCRKPHCRNGVVDMLGHKYHKRQTNDDSSSEKKCYCLIPARLIKYCGYAWIEPY